MQISYLCPPAPLLRRFFLGPLLGLGTQAASCLCLCLCSLCCSDSRVLLTLLAAGAEFYRGGGGLARLRSTCQVLKRIPPKLEALTPHKGHIHKRREQGTEAANAQAARRRAQFMAERGGRGSNPGGTACPHVVALLLPLLWVLRLCSERTCRTLGCEALFLA